MLFGLFWLLSRRFASKFRRLGASTFALVGLAYYALLALGIFNSPVPGDASAILFTKLPFFAWALMLGSISLPSRVMHTVLRVFIIAMSGAILYALLLAVLRYADSGEISEFFFERLMRWSVIPPHYLGMYLNFGYGILLYKELSGKPFFKPRWLNILLLIIAALGIVMLAVRMQYVIFIILSLGIILLAARRRFGLTKALLSLLAILTVMALLAWSFKPTRSRLVDTYNEFRAIDGMVDYKQTNPRIFLWKHGGEVIRKNFWLGTGGEVANDALNQELKKDDKAVFWDGSDTYMLYERGYNYHNVFLQHFATYGLPGILLVSAFFWLPVFKKPNHFRAEAAIFLLVCGFSFSTESMLERQAGILFFSFFFFLFFGLNWEARKVRIKEQGENNIEQENTPGSFKHRLGNHTDSKKS